MEQELLESNVLYNMRSLIFMIGPGYNQKHYRLRTSSKKAFEKPSKGS